MLFLLWLSVLVVGASGESPLKEDDENTILKLCFILTFWCGEHAGCWHNSMWDPLLMPWDRYIKEKRAQITLYTNMKLNLASPGGFYSTQKLWNIEWKSCRLPLFLHRGTSKRLQEKVSPDEMLQLWGDFMFKIKLILTN